MAEELKVTSLEEIKKSASGQLIAFTGWDEKPWIAKVKRVSLLDMISEGVIPNSLLSAAEQVFAGKQSSKKPVDIKETGTVFKAVAEAVLVEPTWNDLQDAGVKVTDEQLSELFQYAQGGINGLKRFRAEQKYIANNKPVGALQQAAK